MENRKCPDCDTEVPDEFPDAILVHHDDTWHEWRLPAEDEE